MCKILIRYNKIDKIIYLQKLFPYFRFLKLIRLLKTETLHIFDIKIASESLSSFSVIMFLSILSLVSLSAKPES